MSWIAEKITTNLYNVSQNLALLHRIKWLSNVEAFNCSIGLMCSALVKSINYIQPFRRIEVWHHLGETAT